jgi:zinc protease
MFKKYLTILLCIFAGCTMSMKVQGQQVTPLPLDPQVKQGTLPNGLTYFILHNEEPKERANFYIAQKVGSTLETPQQLGLAHFLEHMAFNGTTNYPGKNMLNYLQNKGIRFGADINAYTSFDETVYNINNVPTSDKALMDSVLLVLHDWSGDILLEGDEIDAERGVIQEEWRMRNNAQTRFYTALLPAIYQEYQYQQMPIGKMEIVMNFPYDDIRNYYKKWYRPDQQGIVIVGDFDVNEMEKKVIDMFSSIKMPENAAERTYPDVSDNKEPLYFAYSDKEATFTYVTISFKEDPTPKEMRNSVEIYVNDMIKSAIAQMINNRLDEYAQTAECPYIQAGAEFGQFYISCTKDAFDVSVVPKQDVESATKAAMEIVARAIKTGFTQSEYDRVKDEMLAQYEKAYNEKDKVNNDRRAQELIRHFISNEAAPGIETEYMLAQQVLGNIPVEMINQSLDDILTAENQCIVVFQPETSALPEKETMVNLVENAINKEYEAYVDEVITEPLIAKLPKAGKVKSTTTNEAFGTTEYILSNGVKVIVKPTDFASDEIIMSAYSQGGKQMFAPENNANMMCLDDAISASKVGNFNNTMMNKYLAGKKVDFSISLGNKYNVIEGNSTKKDLTTLMELIYANFTDLRADEEQFNTEIQKAIPMLEMAKNNPNMAFRDSMNNAMYNGDQRFINPTPELLKRANYKEMLAYAKNMLSNAKDFTFIFTGNIDLDTFVPLMEQYIATLPAKKTATKLGTVYPIEFAKGKVEKSFTQEMATPATMIYNVISDTEEPYSIYDEVKVDLAGEILSNIYTRTIREEEGGAYSPYAYGRTLSNFNLWQLVSVIQTNAEQRDKMFEIAQREIKNLLENGASEDDFNKVKGAALNQYEINVRKNSYWDNNLFQYEIGLDKITNHRNAIESLTLADFNAWLKKCYNGKNSITVIMTGVEQSK